MMLLVHGAHDTVSTRSSTGRLGGVNTAFTPSPARLLMTNDILGGNPASAPSASAPGRATAILERVEHYGKTAQSLLAILGLASSIAVVPFMLLLNHYLAAFGQPALASVGEWVGFLSTIFPFFLINVGMLTALAASPTVIRWCVGMPEFGDHPFAGAYGWISKDARSADLLRGLRAYAFTHGPALLVAGLTISSPYIRIAITALPPIFIAAVAVICVIDAFLTPPRTEKSAIDRFISAFLAAFLVNFMMLFWTLLLAQVALHAAGFTDQPLAAIPIICGLVVVHVVVSAAPFRPAVGLSLAVAAAAIYLAGMIAITAVSLKWANLGGGKPTMYRSSAADTPVVACEILSIRDTRILWLPDKAGEITPVQPLGAMQKGASDDTSAEKKTPCDWVEFRERAKRGAALAAAGDPAAADAVRVFSREALYDRP